jgi:uncharacterized protein YjdB
MKRFLIYGIVLLFVLTACEDAVFGSPGPGTGSENSDTGKPGDSDTSEPGGSGTSEPGVAVTGVSISPDLASDSLSLALAPGDSGILAATVEPANAGNKAVTWKSSDTGVATVKVNGDGTVTVTGVAQGTAIVTVTTADGGKRATRIVDVDPAVTRVTGVSLDHSGLNLAPEGSGTLTATVEPADATNPAVLWESSDTTIAAVDGDGTVTGIAVGKATVTVATADGGFTKTCEVTVTGVSLNQDRLAIAAGAYATLNAAVLPADAPQTVTWESSEPSVATVDANTGTVTGVAPGRTVITATMTGGGMTATRFVDVYAPVAVNSTEQWAAALDAISNAPDGSADSPSVFGLVLTGDFGVRGYSYPNITGAYKEVWLTGEKTISLDFSIAGLGEFPESHSIIDVDVTQTFVIDGPTLEGNAEHSRSLVNIRGGAVELRNGHLKDNTNCNSVGAGVYVYGIFTMKGGTISGNSGGNGGGNGGGVHVRNGTFIMDGGSITGNGTTTHNGGGVYVNGNSATFIMNGGSITDNEGKYGGGVCLISGGTFTMNGGTISGNKVVTASRKNGVYYEGEDSFIRNGGDWQTD